VTRINKRAEGASPDFTGDSDLDDKEPHRPRQMFYPQGAIDLKDQLWDMKRAAGHYDDVLGPVPDDELAPLARLIRVVKRGNFVILDTETTGLGPDAEICQIAIISPTGEKLLDTLVKPVRPIPSDATRIHGITNDMVKDARSWMNVGPDAWDLITGCDVIVYNAEYDFRLMEQSEKALEHIAVLDWSTLSRACAMEAYAEWDGDWNERKGGYRWHKLVDAVPTDFQMPADVKAHSAFGDCLMTLAVCRYLVDSAQ
jgi:DNA polymerase-3 subunit epsilon